MRYLVGGLEHGFYFSIYWEHSDDIGPLKMPIVNSFWLVVWNIWIHLDYFSQ